ncbi:hypothetical protein BKA70DRAFT_1433361 [Coprinopsis sp. MPI-PUGE-AT-0042]|nr:hypothetical protein BKA70DRAFT_1433361 [Coprinopsis sp. MPI-PUGE-AT-0042]
MSEGPDWFGSALRGSGDWGCDNLNAGKRVYSSLVNGVAGEGGLTESEVDADEGEVDDDETSSALEPDTVGVTADVHDGNELLRSLLGKGPKPQRAADTSAPPSRAGTQSPTKGASQTGITFKILKLPCTCEVSSPALLDPVLMKKKGLYPANLPNLTSGKFVSSPVSDEIRVHFPVPSYLLTLMPNMNHGLLWDAMRFVQSGQFVNLARVDPSLIGIRVISVGRNAKPEDVKYEFAFEEGTCVFLKTGVIEESHVRVPRDRPADAVYHSLQANVVDFTFEGHRWRAGVCMILGTDKVKVPVFNSAIAYSTLTAPINPRPTAGGLWSRPGAINTAQMTTGTSPTVKALKMAEGVPVYDGRYIKFDYNVDLPRIDSILPKWPAKDEIPDGHPVVFAHVLHAKKESGLWTPSPYIHWIIVLGSLAQQKKSPVRVEPLST